MRGLRGRTSTCVGVRCKDGIVLAVEKLLTSKMLVATSNRKIYHVDDHIGVVRPTTRRGCA